MRRSTCLVCSGLGLVAFAALTGCADSTSPAMRAWERSSGMAQTQQQTTSRQGYMVASDSFGSLVFEQDPRAGSGSTVANAPTE